MTRTIAAAAAFLLFAAGASAEPLDILSTTPSGDLTERRDSVEVAVTFNQPMVPLAAPETTGKFCPIELKPAVKGSCVWQGGNVLTFVPAEPLPMATRFDVRVPAGIASQVSGEKLEEARSWSFATLRPGVVRSDPPQGTIWRQPGEELFLQFNMDVDPKVIRRWIKLYESRGGAREEELAVGVRRAKDEEIKKLWPWCDGVQASTWNVVALHPSRPMVRGAAYRVSVGKGLKALQGALGLDEEKSIAFETYFPFEMLEPAQEFSFCLPKGVRLAFSNPVLFETLLKNISFEPAVDISSDALSWSEPWTGYQDHSDRRVYFDIWAALKPDTAYTLKVSSALTDLAGGPLGRNVAVPLRTEGYCPYFSMPTGVGVLEGYLPHMHPVDLLNTGPLPVRMARIPEESLIPFHKDWNRNHSEALAAVPAKVEQFDWQPPIPRNARMWQGLDLDRALAGAPSGIVFVEAQFGGSWHRALLNVTKLGLSIKASPETTFVETTFLRNANPAKGAQIEIRDDANKVLWTGVTDKEGVLKAPGWKGLGIKAWDRWQVPRLWVFARVGLESAVAATDWKGGISPWRFNISYDSHPRPEAYHGELFTDRGVYRSGETVRVKGLVRRLDLGDWDKSGLDKVFVTVSDPRGSQVFKTTVPVSAASSFDFSYRVPEESPTGYWGLRVRGYAPGEGEPLDLPIVDVDRVVDGEEGEWRPTEGDHPDKALVEMNEGFRVEPFKPASFEVRAVPLQEHYVAGEKLEASVDGWYLFGAPMADAPAEWKLRLEPGRFSPPGREEYDFGPAWWEEGQEMESRLLASGEGKLDDKGKLRVESVLATDGARRTITATLEASATSPERQRLSGRGSVSVHPAAVYPGLKPLKYFVEKGKPLACDMIVVSPDGKPAEGVALTARLTRRFWQSVQKTGVGGRLEWVSERRDVVVATRTFTSGKDPVRFEEEAAETGQYLLEAEVTDAAGRTSATGASFYVTGKGDAWWARDDNDIIELVPEKKEYKPGETARIMVKSPYEKVRAMVTVERETVISHFFTRLDGGADFIEVPLTDKHVPNVYVGVMLLQGRTKEKVFDDASDDDLGKPQIKIGYASLRVNPGGRKLSIAVETDKGEYRPRGRVKAKVLVQDADKKGAQAELTVFAVDEGVLSLTGYATPDVFSGFYGPRALQLSTADSRLYVIGQRNFGHKGKPRGGGGGSSLSGIDLRSLFVPTVYWSPAIRTDAEGRAEVEFDLPDNLSRFRVMAVAHEGRRFGSGDSKFTVKKPLLIRPSLPRFARLGDAFKGGMVVHNYTAADATVSFKTDLKGDAVACEGAGAAQERLIPAGRAVEVLWDCGAKGLGKASFEFVARAGEETDGLRWEVPVILPATLETVATSGAVSDKPASEKVEPPAGALPGIGGLEVGLSATALSGLQEGVRFLLEYPYGCLEQKLSRIMPVLVGADLVAAFGLGDLSGLKDATRDVLTKMPAYQLGSGGFTYWLNGWREPDPYLTSYALEALSLAKREGYYVDQRMTDRAVAWLDRWVKGQDVKTAYPYTRQEKLTSQAYAVYALSMHGSRQDAAMTELFEARAQLHSEGQAHMLRAASQLGLEPMARELAKALLNRVRLSPTTLYFDDGEAEEMPWIHASAARSTANGLQAMLQARGGFAGDEKAVRWLMEERKIKGRWRTTQENSAALRALQDFYRRYEKDVPDFKALVGVGEGPGSSWEETFKGRDLAARKKSFPMSGLEGKSTKVSLEKQGPGRLYYTMRLAYAPGTIVPGKDLGFRIERKLKKLYGPGEGETLGAGSRAVVTVKVKTPKDRTFVVLDYPLPAGFEIVDPSFAVESQEDAHLLAERAEKGEEWGGFQRSEKYDDRLVVFADYLPAGEHSYSFLVQATVAGTFAAPPPTVEQMYQPEVFGRGAGEILEVK